MISQSQLRQIMTRGSERVATFYPFLVAGMRDYAIEGKLREAAFIATIAHESSELLRTTERGSGDGPDADKLDDYLQKYDTGSLAKKLGNTPAADGDGVRYKGRGLIMVTGRDNYEDVSEALGYDFLSDPQRLATPEWATRASCWWWAKHGCNELADIGNFGGVTRRVNGGLNGWEQRLNYYNRALEVLKPDFSNVQAGVESTATWERQGTNPQPGDINYPDSSYGKT